MSGFYFRRGLLSARVVGGAAVSAMLLSCVSTAPAAFAQETVESAASVDVADLVARVSDVAQKVSAKNEEVKGMEDRLAEAQAQVDDYTRKAEEAEDAAEAAAAQVAEKQGRVDGIAQSRYRGDSRDFVRGALAARDPATAVERMGYLGAISQTAKKQLDAMSAAARDARGKKSAADEAVKVAQAKAEDLAKQKEQLFKEKESLDKQQQDIEAQVNALSPEQRALWESQFGGSTKIDLASLGSGSSSAAVQAALTKLGAPYGWGAVGPDVFDCSGLMLWSYQQMGKSIPRTSQAQIAGGTPVPVDQLQPGDIVGYYEGVTHVGMYIGDGQVVHASTYGVPVQVVPLNSMPITGTARY
ncbi:NlpC/P60 family protein [Corynebacterium flavescens]|uniref:NlpC/P60 family protein n=1 Tax=Corynebacterium flavescens TaxID=28028 RepID=UPI003FD3BBBB